VDADNLHAHAWQSWAVFEKNCGNIELAKVLFNQGIRLDILMVKDLIICDLITRIEEKSNPRSVVASVRCLGNTAK
jgi:hypothetical protein